MFLTASSFTGFYRVASDCYDDQNGLGIQPYIEQFEPWYLKKLMGCELYDLFIADLDGGVPPVPTSQRFTDIFEPLCVDDLCGTNISVRGYGSFLDDDCGCHNEQHQSEGIVTMLKGLIYWHYVRDQPYLNTTAGTRVQNNETTREITNVEKSSDIAERWNQAWRSFDAIQYFICMNQSSYTEYRGTTLDPLAMGGAF